MPLPQLRCKGEYMPKSIVQILFDSKREVEREIKIVSVEGREKETEKERLSKDVTTTHSDGVPLVLFFWSSW